MSENVGASTSRNPKGFHGLYRDNFTFTNIFIYLWADEVVSSDTSRSRLLGGWYISDNLGRNCKETVVAKSRVTYA
jgi:hypothetical protein